MPLKVPSMRVQNKRACVSLPDAASGRRRTIYLGDPGSEEAETEYRRVVGEWLAAGGVLAAVSIKRKRVEQQPTVADVFAAYAASDMSEHARGELAAIRPRVVERYGDTPAADFTPMMLKAIVEQAFGTATRKLLSKNGNEFDTGSPWKRSTITRRQREVVRIFEYGVTVGLVPVTVPQALTMLRSPKIGLESKPVRVVPRGHIRLCWPHMSKRIRAMVLVQLLTGARPGEVVAMTPGQIDRSRQIWSYVPSTHKTAYRGDVRRIELGPRCQRVLMPFMLRPDDKALFSPRETWREWLQDRNEARKTPNSCGNRPGTNVAQDPKWQPGEEYSVDSYRRAISRACDLAGIEHWTPHRLRHSAATKIRRVFGLEAARVVLGHTDANLTAAVYAERDERLASDVAKKMG